MPENSLEGLSIRMSTVEKRIERNDQRLEKLETDALKTDVAVLKVEVAGLNKKSDVQDAELNLLRTKVTSSSGSWSGARTTVMLTLAVIGGLGGLIFGILQAAGH